MSVKTEGPIDAGPESTVRAAGEEGLRQSIAQLRFALETIHTGGWELDLADRTATRTLEHDRIFGYPALLPKWTYEMFLGHVLPEDRAEVDGTFRKAVETRSDWSFECRIRRADGEIRWIWAAGRHRPDPEGNLRFMSGVVQDITERKLVEEELNRHRNTLAELVLERTQELYDKNMQLEGEVTERRKAEEMLKTERQRLFDVLETLPATIFLLTPDYRLVFANRAYRKRFGEPDGRRCYELCYGLAEPCVSCEVERVFKTGSPAYWEMMTPDETAVYDIDVFPFADADGSRLVHGLLNDITPQRRAENTLRQKERQVRLLSARLISAQETERRRLSMEIHDGLGQALTVTKLRLGVIDKWLDKNRKTAKEACAGLSDYLDHVIEDVRRLSRSLSPIVLEDLGLTAAIRWLVKNSSIPGVENVKADIAEVDGLVPKDDWITAYRAMQEALGNAMKHSGARNLSVVVRPSKGSVDFQVEDDGVGFDPEKAMAKGATEKGLGLSTMSERVEMIGGSFRLTSREGGGTRVFFSLPVREIDA